MNIESLIHLSQKPLPFTRSTAPFWDDPHISKGLLKAHLNTEWDAASRNHTTIKASVEWLCDEILPPPPGPILDLGCGPGLYCALLAHKGYQMTGLDLSSRSLTYAREYAIKEGLEIEYHLLDYLMMDYFAYFQAVLLIYCDFCVLSPERRSLLLKRVKRSLVPGGLFIFDVFTPNQREEEPQTPFWEAKEEGFWSSDPHLVLEKHFYYQKEELHLNQTIVIQQEGVEVYRFWEQYYRPPEIESELIEAGFNEIEIYASIVGDTYSKGSKTMAIVAH